MHVYEVDLGALILRKFMKSLLEDDLLGTVFPCVKVHMYDVTIRGHVGCRPGAPSLKHSTCPKGWKSYARADALQHRVPNPQCPILQPCTRHIGDIATGPPCQHRIQHHQTPSQGVMRADLQLKSGNDGLMWNPLRPDMFNCLTCKLLTLSPLYRAARQ